MLSVTSNVDKLVNSWKRREAKLRPEMSKAVRDNTMDLWQESKKQMVRLIYSKPVPNRAQVAREKGQVVSKGRGRKSKAVLGGFVTINGQPVMLPLTGKWANRRAWTRTGNLKRSERMKMTSPYVGIIYNAAKRKSGKGYAKIRHDMKSRFPAPWRAVAIQIVTPRARKRNSEAMRRALIGA